MPVVESHDDVPRAMSEECRADLVRPVRCTSDHNAILDVHAVHLRESLVENTVARGATTCLCDRV